MKFALVEIGGSHDECLYSQLLFLKKEGHFTHLICSDNLVKQVGDFDSFDAKYFLDFKKSKWSRIKSVYKLWKQIRKEKYDRVIFNTAQGSLLRILMLLPYAKETAFVGVMHNANKLFKSNSQKIINRKIKKYFVLNDYILPIQKDLPNLKITSFYPIFFPSYKSIDTLKPPNEIWICIPGQLQQKRRDYFGLIHALEAKCIPDNVRFLLLGRCSNENEGSEIKGIIEEKGISKSFVFWEKFISNEVFYNYIQKSDYIMPLVSADKEPAYLTHKISGSFNLAFAYKKPLLMEEQFQHIKDFKENSFFYKYNSLNKLLHKLANNSSTKILYQDSKWNLEYQQQKYLEFVES